MIDEDDDDSEPESVGVDKLDDVDEWKRKGLLRVEDGKYEWLRRGIKGGAFGGFIIGGMFGLLFIVAFVFILADVTTDSTPVSSVVCDWEFWTAIGSIVLAGMIIALPGIVAGIAAGVAVCRLIKGKSWLYGTLSTVAGLIGGVAWMVFLCVKDGWGWG